MLCMPKKKNTHIASDMNCTDRGRASILFERMAPMLLLLLALPEEGLDNTRVLDGVVGQLSSSAAVILMSFVGVFMGKEEV